MPYNRGGARRGGMGGGGGSKTWVGLVETPSGITADQVVKGNPGGTALIFGNVSAGAADVVEEDINAAETIAVGDPVYRSGTGTVGKANASDVAKSRVIGLCRVGATVGNPATIVRLGRCASVITGASVDDVYFLKSGGGISSDPATDVTVGHRLIRLGQALNSTDLDVNVEDHGTQSAAH